jgi:hypothetical protein
MTNLRVAFRNFANRLKKVWNVDLNNMATVKLARTWTKFRKSGINTFFQVPVHQSKIRSAGRNTLTKLFRAEWCSSLAASVAEICRRTTIFRNVNQDPEAFSILNFTLYIFAEVSMSRCSLSSALAAMYGRPERVYNSI